MKLKRYNKFLESITQKLNIEQRIPADIPLPHDIVEISKAYMDAGKDIFLVGGAVRDFIQGIKPKDYDLVTNALPNESKKILKGFNVSDEQGKNFGVLRVYTKDEPEGYEIASYRRDISGGRDTKGNDKKVHMGSDVTIEDDCNRRDLTMNALFYDIKNKEIIDLVGGVKDIKSSIVRAVGDANQRFIEDRLRICRIFRFAARIGGKIDAITANAIKKDNRLRGIGPNDDVSQERIWDEMTKAWKQVKNYNYYLNFLTEFNMWGQMFPGSNINTVLIDTDDFIVIIANLFKNENYIGLSNKLSQSYKIPLDISTKVAFLISLLSFSPDEVFDFYKRKQQCSISNETILEWIRTQGLDLIKFLDYTPTISAQELMSMGYSGKELGIKIKQLEAEKYKKML